MKTFEELYKDVLSRKISLKEPLPSEYNPLHLDCLLHPKNYAPVIPCAARSRPLDLQEW